MFPSGLASRKQPVSGAEIWWAQISLSFGAALEVLASPADPLAAAVSAGCCCSCCFSAAIRFALNLLQSSLPGATSAESWLGSVSSLPLAAAERSLTHRLCLRQMCASQSNPNNSDSAVKIERCLARKSRYMCCPCCGIPFGRRVPTF